MCSITWPNAALARHVNRVSRTRPMITAIGHASYAIYGGRMSKTAIASAYHYLGISSADLAVLVYDTFNLNSDRDSFVDSRTIIRCFDAVTTPAQYPEPPDEFIQDRVKYMRRAKTTRKAARLGPSHVGSMVFTTSVTAIRKRCTKLSWVCGWKVQARAICH
ncbi:hypothetical protein IF2G_10975 [Cordyceps javanica]|nr:hypothetical protein IF2G_10975 [Cordyceps javanica]